MMRYLGVVAAMLLQVQFASVAVAHAHGDNESSHETTGMVTGRDISTTPASSAPSHLHQPDSHGMPSYAGISEYSSMMIAHIIFMVIAWFIILPIGMIWLHPRP